MTLKQGKSELNGTSNTKIKVENFPKLPQMISQPILETEEQK